MIRLSPLFAVATGLITASQSVVRAAPPEELIKTFDKTCFSKSDSRLQPDQTAFYDHDAFREHSKLDHTLKKAKRFYYESFQRNNLQPITDQSTLDEYVRLLEVSAAAKNPMALLQLSRMLRSETYEKRDLNKSKSALEKAAKLGYRAAQIELAQWLLNEKNPNKDPDYGRCWLEHLAQWTVHSTQANKKPYDLGRGYDGVLALIYHYAPNDIAQAEKWLTIADFTRRHVDDAKSKHQDTSLPAYVTYWGAKSHLELKKGDENKALHALNNALNQGRDNTAVVYEISRLLFDHNADFRNIKAKRQKYLSNGAFLRRHFATHPYVSNKLQAHAKKNLLVRSDKSEILTGFDDKAKKKHADLYKALKASVPVPTTQKLYRSSIAIATEIFKTSDTSLGRAKSRARESKKFIEKGKACLELQDSITAKLTSADAALEAGKKKKVTQCLAPMWLETARVSLNQGSMLQNVYAKSCSEWGGGLDIGTLTDAQVQQVTDELNTKFTSIFIKLAQLEDDVKGMETKHFVACE